MRLCYVGVNPDLRFLEVCKSMLRFVLLSVFIACAAMLNALPYDSGVVTVADREFYVGEVTPEYTRLLERFSEDGTDNSRVFVWRFSLELKRVVEQTPVLIGQGVEFLQTGIPAEQLINNPSRVRNGDFGVIADPLYASEDHLVLSNGYSDFRLLPINSNLTYSAFCVEGIEDGQFRYCALTVKYPYATHVALTTEEFFPGTLLEASSDFEEIARQMIQIAVCIDVTDRELSPEERFDNCKIDLSS
jgi:hypothetical protein